MIQIHKMNFRQKIAKNRLFPLIFLSIMASQASAAIASGNRIYEVIDSEPMVQNKPNAKVLSDLTGQVAFEAVSFSYAQGRAQNDGFGSGLLGHGRVGELQKHAGG